MVYRESVPDFRGHFGAVDIAQGLLAMNIEVVHYQMNGLRVRILQRQGDGKLSELKGRTVGCRKGEMSSCFRLYDAKKNVGSPVTLVFVIPAVLPVP